MCFPEREMLLAPILPRQGLCMLHAQRGIGKTYVSLSVAVAVASGGKTFDRWIAPKPAKVLFIDGEMPARTLQERLASLINGSDSEPPSADYLRILTPDMQYGAMPNLATSEGQKAIEPLLQGIDLVILDNLATLARHGRSNDEDSWICGPDAASFEAQLETHDHALFWTTKSI
jgi:putative DNA primase/helicase